MINLRLIDQIAKWEETLALRRTAVLAVTVWMTWEAFTWAKGYASGVTLSDGNALAAAAMIGAVTAPIAMLQASVFKAYIESKPGTST